MKEAQARFEQYLKRRFGQTSTRKHYRSDLNIFINTIGNKAPEAVMPQDIDTFVDQQIAAGLSPITINHRLSSLHTFFEYWASDKLAQNWPNPVIKRRHRLKTGSRLPRDVADNDVARLFAVITDERDQAIFGLMCGAGLRLGEIVALRFESIEEPVKADQLTKLRVRGKGSKERMVWLTEALWETLQAWLKVRPLVETDHVFVNHHGRPISESGIQYRLKQHCRAAGVSFSSHQLRHTYARRLAENGLPVDSLARLLGHSQLQTTQRYIDGADPTLRADFSKAMARLEQNLIRDQSPPLEPPPPKSPRQPRRAPQTDLVKLRQRLVDFPPWLGEAVDAYLSWRWPTWRAQTAMQSGNDIISLVRRLWTWLDEHRQVDSWESFRRADLEAWLQAYAHRGVSKVTLRYHLSQVRSLLKFLEVRDYPLDPGLFRIQPPKLTAKSLPRHLTEVEYRRLERVILEATEADTFRACFDRAWFFTLAHTAVRISELLDLRLEDLSLAEGYLTVRGTKPGRDRVVYLTPFLQRVLRRYLVKRPDLPEEDRLFVLKRGSPSRKTVYEWLIKYGQQAGVHATAHKLRHTLATRLINQGMPIHSLRRLLGHQHLDTTQIYARIYDETLYQQFKEAMSRLEAIEVEDWPGVETNEPALMEISNADQK